MKFFEKKNCSVCGKKIGLMGNRKLDDGNLCKDCAKDLSPFFSDRKRSTVEDIKEQLAYREANKADVSNFRVTRTLGRGTKVLLDEDARKFIVSGSNRWQTENPDVLDFAQVTGSHLDINEDEKEIMRKDKDGNEKSYNPRRFEYEFDFWMKIYVNHPYFSEIKFRINNNTIRVEQAGGFMIRSAKDIGESNAEYRQCQEIAREIHETLTQVRENIREDIAAANAPRVAQVCPLCGATTTPDEQGRCEFCGGAVMQ